MATGKRNDKKYRARRDKLMRQTEDILGREPIAKALLSNSDLRIQSFAAQLVDPGNANTTMSRIAEKLGLKWDDIVEAFRKSKIAEGNLRMFQHIPQIMEDTAIDSKSKLKMCPMCEGKGKSGEQDCMECEGTGRVRVAGNTEARKIVFESAGLIGKKGPLFALQQFNNLDGSESFEELVGATQKVLGPAKVEVTAIEEDAKS